MLALLQLGAPGEREPRGEPGDAERDGDAVLDTLRNGVSGAGVDEDALGHRPEGAIGASK